ncbi:50S ribosomal protein L13 [Patescibacteria group bacterium]|nr:50S ribosomal protein L13 [Patescibacteria group bacterium]MBU4162431.1 50S ribosomal protein L13 [Patescibacteria group bacterium]
MERQTHTIDAAGRPLGRVATQVVALLRGKHKEDFVPNKDIGDFVVITNFGKVKFTGKKLEKKNYYRYSGYPGGLKEIPLSRIFSQDPAQVMRRAVLGMLPKNKLRDQQIKRLKVEL